MLTLNCAATCRRTGAALRHAAALAALGLVCGGPVSASDSSAPTSTVRPKIYALISAIGTEVQHVSLKPSVGSNIEPYRRQYLHLKTSTLDLMALRGMDAGVAAAEPNSRRFYFAVNVPSSELYGRSLFSDRALEVALDRVRSMPERATWDEILIMTPMSRYNPVEGMAPGLGGAGIYIHEMPTSEMEDHPASRFFAMRERVVSPDGREHGSRSYIAVYVYTTVRRLDAKTLEVIRSEVNLQTLKSHDPDSDAIRLANSIPALTLYTRMHEMTETTAERSTLRVHGRVMPGGLIILGPVEEGSVNRRSESNPSSE